jgi:hypothetical protein
VTAATGHPGKRAAHPRAPSAVTAAGRRKKAVRKRIANASAMPGSPVEPYSRASGRSLAAIARFRPEKEFIVIRPFVCLVLVAGSALAGSPTQSRNDTGVAACYANPDVQPDCGQNDYPGQDARFGRDAAAAYGALTKIGGGRAGFDFTKIANDGSDLPADATLGDGPGDWACTRDNVTGFVWEVKTQDGGLRDSGWTYTWYNSDATSNGGDAGVAGGDTCGATLGGQCDTEHYVDAVNATGLCGGNDWRMPHIDELHGLIDYSRTAGAALETTYFPTTQPAIHWSGDPYAAPATIFAHFIDFYFDGAINMDMKMNAHRAKLVRAPVPTAVRLGDAR